MQRVLTLLAAVLTMACVRGDVTLVADLVRAELSTVERQLVSERFGANFAEAARFGRSDDSLFDFARCEFSAMSPHALVVVGRAPTHCAGCDATGSPICVL